MKKLLPPVYFLSSLFLMLLLFFVFPRAKIIDFPWNLTGLIFIASGIYVTLATDLHFKKRGTTVKPFFESEELVTEGLYEISRNPMYLGMGLILLGLGLISGNLLLILAAPLFLLAMDKIFVRPEEKMLEKKFGKKWQEYKNKVRKWL